MEQLNMNQLLNRMNEVKIIKDALIHFEKNETFFGSPPKNRGSLTLSHLVTLKVFVVQSSYTHQTMRLL